VSAKQPCGYPNHHHHYTASDAWVQRSSLRSVFSMETIGNLVTYTCISTPLSCAASAEDSWDNRSCEEQDFMTRLLMTSNVLYVLLEPANGSVRFRCRTLDLNGQRLLVFALKSWSFVHTAVCTLCTPITIKSLGYCAMHNYTEMNTSWNKRNAFCPAWPLIELLKTRDWEWVGQWVHGCKTEWLKIL